MPGGAGQHTARLAASPALTGGGEVGLIALICVAAACAAVWRASKTNDPAERRVIWGASLATALVFIQIVLVVRDVGTARASDLTSPDSIVNFGFAILIGLLVGATELMSRYRDDPFAPLISLPGLFYSLINGGASALAYYLLRLLAPQMSEPLRTFTAGIAAMTFFRSSLFTVRLAGNDVPVGPNLVLLTLLKALDRAYDRTRAEPRSTLIRRIMGHLAFDQVKNALPALCFDLMQNLSPDETASINAQVTQLSQSTAMSDQSKCLSLGLALLNLVGERTLKAAVAALGSGARAFRQVNDSLLLKLATPPPSVVLDTLPAICEALYSATAGDDDDRKPLRPTRVPDLSADSQVVLLAYQLVNFYGDQLVLAASNLVKATAAAEPSGSVAATGAVSP